MTRDSHSPTEFHLPVIALGLAMAVALALRLPGMAQSLWFDEACMSGQRLGSLARLASLLYVDIHPPLYVLWMVVSNHLFGDSEVSMRMLPLLSGLASLPLAFDVGRRLVGPRAALWSVWLLALSPVHIWYSTEARLYLPMTFLVLSAVSLYHRLLAGDGRRCIRVLYALVVGLMLSLHYYLVPYVVLFSCAAPWLGRRCAQPEFARRILRTNGVMLALLSLWVGAKLVVAHLETSQAYLRALTLPGLFEFLFAWCWTGNGLSAGLRVSGDNTYRVLWVLSQGLGVVLFAGGLRCALRNPGRELGGPATVLYLLAIPGALLVLPLVGLDATYIERSALPALPFFVFLVALGLTSLRSPFVRRFAQVAVLASCSVNLAAAVVHGEEWTVYKPHPDWRSATAYLSEEIDDGEGDRPLFSALPNPRSLSYYDRRIQQVMNLTADQPGLERLCSILVERLGEGPGGWIAGRARALAKDFERSRAELLEKARMRVYPSGSGRLADLKLPERSPDGVFYLVVNRWWPSRDTAAESLLALPHLRTLEERSFESLKIYKLERRR